MPSAPEPTRSSRRTLVLSIAALAIGSVGVAGCGPAGQGPTPTNPSSGTSDQPSTDGPASADPGQGAAPAVPGALEAALLHETVAADAATVLAVGHKKLGATGRKLITAVRDQQLAHVAALRAPDPTDPNSTAPSPSASPAAEPPSFAKAVAQLEKAAANAATMHRRNTVTADQLTALLWGSLATSAGATATILKAADLAGDDPDPGIAAVGKVRSRSPMPVVPIVAAEQEVVRQLHALIYGYQLALGRLKGARRDAAQTELRRHRVLRDRLATRLLNTKADVPVAKAAYVPSTNPRNATTAAKLIRQIETSFQPFCGLWLAAAATPAERTEALDQLGHTTTVARQWGAALSTWPGWA
ncbi:MAG: DUF4439 domain-containing protein [Microlunatus sp.]